MSGLDPLSASLTIVALFAGGLVKGATSLGLPLVSMPMLASIFDTRIAIIILSVPLVVSDAVFIGKEWRLFREGKGFIGLILFATVGVMIGARFLVRLDAATLSLLLGILTLVFVIAAWFRFVPAIPATLAPFATPFVGFSAGVLRGLAGASGPIVAMYLYSCGVSRYLFAFLFNSVYIILDATMVLALHRLGLYTTETLLFTMGAILPVLGGLYLGIRLQGRFEERTFMRLVLTVLAAAGLNLILIGLGFRVY